MAADYAGACDAIEAKFTAGWVADGAPRTPVGQVNEADPAKVDANGNPAPWVLFEIVSNGSFQNGMGLPGSNVIIYDGLIKVYVFAPSGDGRSAARQLAIAAGEIFRNQVFYSDVTPGCYVRSGYDLQGQPRIDDGVASSLDGEWFNVTSTIPFEYWHRG